ncbi:MAG TPA: alpha/beta hydrolase [Steroidobacteraceae bacterium]|nr:alpha/beta hydrolase [Steroidobacteraceae bacterium]HNS27418.1 alpha/beta hydrolase [Steroidobacteraceae bacterium]
MTPASPRRAAPGVLLALALAALAPAAAAELHHSFVPATDGVPLAVTECGTVAAPAVLLLHGFGQSHLSFSEQFTPQACAQLHLVAFDLRGHGGSGKPWAPEAYSERERWADDVRSVMTARQLDRPLLVGWSFGGNVALHYIAAHGADSLRGLLLVGSHGGLLASATSRGGIRSERMAQLSAAAMTPDIPGQIAAAEAFARMLTAKPLPDALARQLLVANLMLPAYARAAMRGLPVDNSGLEGKLTLPVRIVVGAHDASMDIAALQALAARLPQASLVVYDDSGHSPFLEEAGRFNRELAGFSGAR